MVPWQQLIQVLHTATAPSRNPLGLLRVMFVAGELVAGAVLSVAALPPGLQTVLVVFVVLNPFIFAGVYYNLVRYNHANLYAPHDFRQEANFVALGRHTDSRSKTRVVLHEDSADDSVEIEIEDVDGKDEADNHARLRARILRLITRRPRGIETVVPGEDFCMHVSPSPANRPVPGFYLTDKEDLYCVTQSDILLLGSLTNPVQMSPVPHLDPDAKLVRRRRIDPVGASLSPRLDSNEPEMFEVEIEHDVLEADVDPQIARAATGSRQVGAAG
ncbi:MAG: hypothetical protein H0T76_02100 [Nannocystis sp.]|nr:hypothetical protein [Nannocystis sp.]MBA3545254.1 hypothetical protein [Nannocystis sp.]